MTLAISRCLWDHFDFLSSTSFVIMILAWHIAKNSDTVNLCLAYWLTTDFWISHPTHPEGQRINKVVIRSPVLYHILLSSLAASLGASGRLRQGSTASDRHCSCRHGDTFGGLCAALLPSHVLRTRGNVANGRPPALRTRGNAGDACHSDTWTSCTQVNMESPVRVINLAFPLQPHHEYYITKYEEHGFLWLTQMKDDYISNSHYVAQIHFFLKGWENVLFELGSERVNKNKKSIADLHISKALSSERWIAPSWTSSGDAIPIVLGSPPGQPKRLMLWILKPRGWELKSH